MEGAALIMLRHSSPIKQSSTRLNRSLFEWYCGFEDHFCVLAAYESRLPPQWRHRNLKVRTLVAESEYKQFVTTEQRIPRMLDDVWGHMYATGPQLRKVVAGVMELKLMAVIEEAKNVERARELERQVRELDQRFTGFMKAPLTLEVLQTLRFQQEYYTDQHTTCCPFFPLEPLLFRFAPAGVFIIASLCLQIYLRLVLHPSICAVMDPTLADYRPLQGKTAEEMAIVLCRAFAGLESTLAEFPEIIIPCQSPMMMAGLACPSFLRLWVFCKLLHLDQVGQPLSDVVRKNLAQQWDMPELENLYSHSFIPRTQLERGPADVTGLADGLGKVEIGEGDGEEIEDSNLTKHRGIFMMSGKENEKERERANDSEGGKESKSEAGGTHPVFSF
jgi:hypothetical protein